MSTKFYPLQIPPGVVSQATKQMNSSNWSEVNLMRWREGSIMPVGGQQQYAYQFASRCKKIHSWYGLNATGGESGYFTAYLCETDLYIDARAARCSMSRRRSWDRRPDLRYGRWLWVLVFTTPGHMARRGHWARFFSSTRCPTLTASINFGGVLLGDGVT